MGSKTRYTITAIIRDKKRRILSIGKNSYIKTHPMMKRITQKLGYVDDERVYIHAEIDAINKCSNLDKAYSIEVYNYSHRSSSYRTSKPCEICMSGIRSTSIRYIHYVDLETKLITERVR